ncbi:hypothetical protein [Bacillus toyonensis]|uniref:hypothetical protein n=1 Tax=Bacillus toyonensis TaxID=155322 RepID=UPI001596AB97|nr:hypothetical protein [Bacillus toyonensis]
MLLNPLKEIAKLFVQLMKVYFLLIWVSIKLSVKVCILPVTVVWAIVKKLRRNR